MKRLILPLLLCLAGCNELVYEPCADAGLPEDAQIALDDAASRPTSGLFNSVTACRVVDALAHRYDGEPCVASCPWPGLAGPGHPPQACAPTSVEQCYEALLAANNCVVFETELARCQSDCAPVTP